MPFEVTATRKRPQTFEQLAGQHFVAATLTASLEQGRIAHAYLFPGLVDAEKPVQREYSPKRSTANMGPPRTPAGVVPHAWPSQMVLLSMS